MLNMAAFTGSVNIVGSRLKNATEEEKEVALMVSVIQDNLQTTRLLLAARANPSCTHGGSIPLFQACHRGNVQMMRDLLDAGADVHMRDPNGGTVVQLAARLKRREMVEALLAKAKEQRIMGIIPRIDFHVPVKSGIPLYVVIVAVLIVWWWFR
jgi:ankyrin repeat protein